MPTEDTPADQAPEQSVEDRLAHFLDPQDEQAEEPVAATQEETAQPETFEFEAEGEKFVLPKKLEKALMQEKDYTQKSQSLAEQRKDVERQLAQIKLAQSERQFSESIAPQTQKLQMIDAVLGEFRKLDWSSMTTDDVIRKKLEMDQYKELREATQGEIAQAKTKFEHQFKTELERIKAEANEATKRRITNWSDQTEAEIKSYALEKGITAEELDGVWDPRHREVLWEAAQYRKLKANAQPVTQQAKSVKTNPSNPMPQHVKEKLAFNKQLKSATSVAQRSELATQRLSKIFGD